MNEVTPPSHIHALSNESVAMVLLVDDQAMVGEAIRRLLLGEPDIEFHFASDPEEAMEVAIRIRPTVILQDMVMPSADGISMVRRYRAEPATKDIPIVMLSTREEPKVKADAFEAGANDYLVKLPDRIELIARIRYHSRAYLHLVQRDEAFRALRESQKRLMEVNIELQRFMNMDGLTGLNNRRRFDEYASVEWKRGVREKSLLSVLMIDVDYFKSYNDTYGHLPGDAVLKSIAGVLQANVHRPGDLVARFGGEEFVMILPSTPVASAAQLAEAIRHQVEALNIVHSSSAVADHVTVSIGCSAQTPQADGSLFALIESADIALYDAKKNGRNRVSSRE